MEVERKLEELGLTLPPIPTPVANYLPLVRTGNLLFCLRPRTGCPQGRRGVVHPG